MKRSYSTPEMEVDKFDRFFILTMSSTGTGGSGIDHGGEEVGDDDLASGAKGNNGFYANDVNGTW